MSAADSFRRLMASSRLSMTLAMGGVVAVSFALTASSASAQSVVAVDRELAYNATMSQIAAEQAARGDYQAAKRTAWQIVDPYEGQRRPAEVVGVWFHCGQPIYWPAPPSVCSMPAYSALPVRRAPVPPPAPQPQAQAATPRPAPQPVQPVSYEVPAKEFAPVHGPLPSGYLAADPRHGKLVDFVDDVDSSGTRITMRTYADGHSMIETPRPSPSAK